MNDYIIRVTAGNGSIRAFFATTKNTVNEGFEIHKTSPVVSAAFGRMLTAASIMGAMSKDDDLITISIKGDGPMKGVVATSDSASRVKGYVYESIVDIPLKENGKLDVSSAIGEGTLSIIKDLGLKEPYVGQIPLISGEIADDLTYYYAKSEQIPTAVALSVLVNNDYTIRHSGGFILQMMPDADEEIVYKLEQRLAELPPLSTLFDEGKKIDDIMEIVLADMNIIVNDIIPVSYYCNCSRERVEKALISLGDKELRTILEQDAQATLHCHFCNKDFHFGKEDLETIIESIT